MSGSLKFAGLLLASALVGGLAALPSSEPTRLTFLSVGQGDCAVFETAGHTVLIDVGPNLRGNDAGKRIVVPSLRSRGIGAVDLVLLSHPDADHIGGLGSLLKMMPVGKVAIPAGFAHHQGLLKNLAEAGCPADKIVWLGPGQAAQLGNFTLEVDCPRWFAGDPDNDGSEFVKISSPTATAVFTGDADAATEARMTPGHNWQAQVLKLGHHGSKTASSENWLKAVHPKWAIVSCGRENMYGHPHAQVLERLRRLGIDVARTDLQGNITFELGSSGWERK